LDRAQSQKNILVLNTNQILRSVFTFLVHPIKSPACELILLGLHGSGRGFATAFNPSCQLFPRSPGKPSAYRALLLLPQAFLAKSEPNSPSSVIAFASASALFNRAPHPDPPTDSGKKISTALPPNASIRARKCHCCWRQPFFRIQPAKQVIDFMLQQVCRLTEAERIMGCLSGLSSRASSDQRTPLHR
jgi:hypothetical protein